MARNTPSDVTVVNQLRRRPILVAKNNPEEKFLLETPFFVVGRSNASYCIDDETISRYHCFFTLEGKTWKLYDVSSSGTSVNGLMLKSKEPRILIDRDVIRFGSRRINTYMFYADSREYEKMVAKEKADKEEHDKLKRKLVSFENEILEKNRRIELLEKYGQRMKVKAHEYKKSFKEYVASISDIMETEFKCNVCSELLCEAVSLNCGHMTCKLCLSELKRNNAERLLVCPLCREYVLSIASAYPVNSVLSAVIPKLSEDVKAARYGVLLARGGDASDLDQLMPRTEEVIDLTEED